MAYIYATALPGNIVKIGRCTDDRERPFVAQTYYVEPIELLALWSTIRPAHDERRAAKACCRWHVCRELFRVPVDWLDVVHPAVAAISRVLGPPLPTPSRKRRKDPGDVRRYSRRRVAPASMAETRAAVNKARATLKP